MKETHASSPRSIEVLVFFSPFSPHYPNRAETLYLSPLASPHYHKLEL